MLYTMPNLEYSGNNNFYVHLVADTCVGVVGIRITAMFMSLCRKKFRVFSGHVFVNENYYYKLTWYMLL